MCLHRGSSRKSPATSPTKQPVVELGAAIASSMRVPISATEKMNMKIPIVLTTLCLLVFSMSTIAQDKSEKPGNIAHESTIDGRWEVKLAAEEKPIAVFEFKNTTGVVSGLMIQDGKSTEIKNGTLEGANLKFETL